MSTALAPPPAAPRARGGDSVNEANRRRAEAKASALVSRATFKQALGTVCSRHLRVAGEPCWLLASRTADHRAVCSTRLTSAGYPPLPPRPDNRIRS